MFLLVVQAFKVVPKCPVLICLDLMVAFMTPKEVHFKAPFGLSMLSIADKNNPCSSEASQRTSSHQEDQKGVPAAQYIVKNRKEAKKVSEVDFGPSRDRRN
jgi:hypothetical protein